MTHDEALAELEALRPKEREAWLACESKLSERDAYMKRSEHELSELTQRWSPLGKRKQQLETFLEMT